LHIINAWAETNGCICVIKLCADDAKLYSSFKLGDYSTTLVKAIDHLVEWSKIWQLRIANNKCIAHRVSTSASSDYAIEGYKLQWSNCTRDLGVHMDTDLKFTEHISKIVHTGHSRAALILKCFHTRNPDVLVKAFCTYVRPILEYCTPVWSPHNIGLVDKIEKVQRRFTKRIFCLSNLSYKDLCYR